MSEAGATPGAEPQATPAPAAEPQGTPPVDNATPPPSGDPAPTFVQSNSQPLPQDQVPQHAPKPELQTGDWRELIPADVRDNTVWTKVHSVDDALRSLANAQELIGKKEIPVGLVRPADDASENEKAKFQLDLAEMLGVPDSSSRYVVPEKAQNINGLESLKDIAHKSGIGGQQFTQMMELIADAEAQHISQAQQVQKDALVNLQKEWGASYQQNLQVADIGLDAVDPEGTVRQVLLDSGLINNPAIIKHYHEIGAQFREGSLKTGGEADTLQTLNEQIRELQQKDAYWEQGLDGGVTRKKVNELKDKRRALQG